MRPALDTIGQRFGKLLVLKRMDNSNYGRTQWLCKCDCGNEKIVTRVALVNGSTKSCGCLRKNPFSLEGRKFGKLTVIKLNSIKNNHGFRMWECLCDCGNNVIISSNHLNQKKRKSCGCIVKSGLRNFKNRDDAIWTKLFIDSVIKRAKKEKFEIDITLEDFKKISMETCHYCGIQYDKTREDRISKFTNKPISDTIIKYNGIDRINSSKGYIKENIVSCCAKCNHAKMDLTQEEFYQHIINIYNHFIPKYEDKLLNSISYPVSEDIKIPEWEKEQQKDYEKQIFDKDSESIKNF
jgi:hypothetical protein